MNWANVLKPILVVCCLLVAPAVQADTLFDLSEYAVVTGHAFDLASSQRCLGSGRCKETNPALARFNDPLAFTAAKFGVGGVGLWLTRKIHADHPVLASIINYGIGGTFSAIAIRNTRIGK